MTPIPKTLPEAVTISLVEHPAITAILDGVDAAQLQIKIAEGALYPQVSLTASASNNYDVNITPGQRAFQAEIVGQITIPIYQGGAEYASIRQSKEGLTVQELRADSARDQVRQNVVAAWGLNQASVGVVRAARAAVSANEVALTGVREEAKVGQRTTLDVLNAQQALLQARTTLVQAEQFLFVAIGCWPSQHRDPWPRGRRIRSTGAFRPGEEQVDRGQDAERPVRLYGFREPLAG